MSDPQFVVDGPRIPSEVVRELEEERLVFFCGAGISIGTGLPNFRDLTLEAIKHIDQAPDGIPANPAIHDAYCWGLYDKALDILEHMEGHRGDFRRFVAKRLTSRLQNANQQLRLHRALLDLAKLSHSQNGAERGFRLVTTNFDNRFQKAGLPLRWIEAAPRLARPRANQAGYGTFLHGRIETERAKRDPEHKHLVLTSADFGDAYFRDGYAARFVLELFREFTVLFIGYSLNDPVMRYLMDIFATERQFRPAYAFVAHGEGDAQHERQLWEAKHVCPILYDRRNGHESLTGTLENWALMHRSGSDGRFRLLMEVVDKPFQGDVDLNNLANAAWALADSNHRIARRLASLDPKQNGVDADISWFGPLLEAEVDDPRDDRRPPRKCRLLDINDVAFPLCRWAMRHLESRRLVEWAISNQIILLTKLRQRFLEQLATELYRPGGVKEPFRAFWQLLIEASYAHDEIWAAETLWQVLPGRMIQPETLRAIVPRLQARPSWPGRPYAWPGEGEDPERLVELARYEISDRIDFRDHVRFRDLFSIREACGRNARRDLWPFADDLTSLLLNVCRLGKRIGALFAQDRSRLVRESIASDPRNQLELDKWEWLIEAVVQAFEAACDGREELALSTAQRWRTLWLAEGLSLFGRLYIHAVTRMPELSVDDAIRTCLDRPDTLWKYEYEPELLAFLRTRGLDVNEDLCDMLVGRLLAHPPSGVFPEAYSADDIDRERGQRFAKLRQAGVTLPEEPNALAEAYLDQIPPSEDPRADEVHYRVVKARWVGPPSGKGLISKNVTEIIDLVGQGRDEHNFPLDRWDRAKQVADWLRQDSSRFAETLKVLAERGGAPAGFVEGVFWALRDITNQAEVLNQVKEIVSIISESSSIVDEAFGACAEWIRALGTAEVPDEVFWQLWDVVRSLAPEEDPSNLLDEKVSLDSAINAAGGHLTEAAIDRFWKSEPQAGQGLPAAVSERLASIVSRASQLARHARLICMPPLHALHAVDPEWSQRYLLRHLRWEGNEHGDVAALWSAHLVYGRWSLELMAAFKTDFLEVRAKGVVLEDAAFRGACWRFAALGIDRPGFLSDAEIRAGFHKAGAEGAYFVLDLFEVRLRQSDEPGRQWHEMIGPWLEKHWPRQEAFRTRRVFTAAAGMLMETGEAFPEALQTLDGLHLIGIIDEHHLVLFRLATAENPELREAAEERSPYASRFPFEVCRWLDGILPPDTPGHERQYLLTVVEAIERSLPPGSPEPACLHQLRERAR